MSTLCTIKEGGAGFALKRSLLAMHSLRGGPSYSYSYEQDLDPTEMQFLQGQALQESQQTSGQQVNQSYSQSYWQQNRVGLPGSGTTLEN